MLFSSSLYLYSLDSTLQKKLCLVLGGKRSCVLKEFVVDLQQKYWYKNVLLVMLWHWPKQGIRDGNFALYQASNSGGICTPCPMESANTVTSTLFNLSKVWPTGPTSTLFTLAFPPAPLFNMCWHLVLATSMPRMSCCCHTLWMDWSNMFACCYFCEMMAYLAH